MKQKNQAVKNMAASFIGIGIEQMLARLHSEISLATQFSPALPRRINFGVSLWTSTDVPFPTYSAFESEIQQTQLWQFDTSDWNPDLIVYPTSRIRVRIPCWEGEVRCWKNVEFASDDGTPFKTGELLFKLHSAVVENSRGAGDVVVVSALSMHRYHNRKEPQLYILDEDY